MLLMVALIMVMTTMREFLRCRRRQFSPARRPRLEVRRAVGLGGRRQLSAGRSQHGRVHLNVDGSETFAEDSVVRLEVNVQHRPGRHELRR